MKGVADDFFQNILHERVEIKLFSVNFNFNDSSTTNLRKLKFFTKQIWTN